MAAACQKSETDVLGKGEKENVAERPQTDWRNPRLGLTRSLKICDSSSNKQSRVFGLHEEIL